MALFRYWHHINPTRLPSPIEGIDSITYKEGTTALHRAVLENRRKDFDSLLISPELDINVKTRDGDSALHLALRPVDCQNFFHYTLADELYYVKALLDHGADINSTNSHGWTLLYRACQNNRIDCAHLLLHYGADPRIPCPKELLPFDALCRNCVDYTTLKILYMYTYDTLEPNTMTLSTVSTLIGVSNFRLLREILAKTSKLVVNDPTCLMKVLTNLPFENFEDLIRRYPNIVESIQKLESADISSVILLREAQYLPFFARHLQNVKVFNVDAALKVPSKVSYELLEESLLTILGNGVRIHVNMHRLYALYGCSSLFKTLLEKDIESFDGARGPQFVPAFYNMTQETASPQALKKQFDDQRFFFAEPNQVPSLAQLGRDVARKHLIQKYRITNHREFNRVLQAMPVYNQIKEILRFEKDLYFEGDARPNYLKLVKEMPLLELLNY